MKDTSKMPASTNHVDVLIVGGGPTGLLQAHLLVELGGTGPNHLLLLRLSGL